MNETELLILHRTKFIQRFSITLCLCGNILIEIYGLWKDSKLKFSQHTCIIQDRLNKL